MSTYNDASLIYYPSGFKAGKAYSLKPTDGSGDLTFTRASTATRVNSAGLIEEVATGVPRIDYTGGGCAKLLLEPQRTNLALRSEEFNNAYWTKRNVTINANSTTSPDGNITADELIDNATNFLHDVYFAPSGFIQNTFFTISAFVKPNTITACRLIASSVPNSNAAFASFNLLTQVTTASNSGNFSNATSKIELFTNGWYRVSLTFQTGATGTSWYADGCSLRLEKPYQTQIYSGTGEGIYAWGAQFEQGSYATSYIPTTSTAVTRVADSASKSGISSLINSEEGVLYAEIAALADDLSNRQISLNNGTTDDRIQLYYTTPSNTVSVFYKSQSGATAFILNHTLADITQFNKLAFKWKENDFALWSNGVEVATQTSGVTSIPNTLTRLDFEQFNGSADFYGNCQSLMVFPSALSDTELATLTTL